MVQHHFTWIKRHCLRTADPGLLLPLLYFYHNGRDIAAVWQADGRDSLPNMCGEFVDSGSDHLPRQDVEDALAGFIGEVLALVDGLDDPRVHTLKGLWQAIQSANEEESRFCITAGRMGLNPYDPSEVTDDLVSFIETDLGDPDVPLNRDVIEVATADSIAAQWDWVQRANRELGLGPMPASRSISVFNDRVSIPHEYGYATAAFIRGSAGLDKSSPVDSVESSALHALGAPLRMESRNHLRGRDIRAAVGWTMNDGAVVAGPDVLGEHSRRFLLARGLFHAVSSCDQGPRLVTNAFTWQQQASRAFAAEFLAPRQALVAETGELADRSMVHNLAGRFQVSTKVIEKQLENAGVTLIEE